MTIFITTLKTEVPLDDILKDEFYGDTLQEVNGAIDIHEAGYSTVDFNREYRRFKFDNGVQPKEFGLTEMANMPLDDLEGYRNIHAMLGPRVCRVRICSGRVTVGVA